MAHVIFTNLPMPTLPREEGEWTPRGTETDVAQIFVSAYRFPATFVCMFHPDRLAGQITHSEYWPEDSDTDSQTGRPPSGTYVMA